MDRKRPTDGNALFQKASTSSSDFSKGAQGTNDTEPLSASEGYLPRDSNRCELKITKIPGEAASAEEEAAATFPAELKKQ